ncbi:MAG TPA: hypothetical protein VMB81_09665 [Candidatus Sulfotelmatobacter sp.]|nr:hypothetical protein [Candidatus Sulfotelmatobacter sp.]
MMRLKNIAWSAAASRAYMPLLSQQRQPIDVLLRGLREADVPGAPFRPIDEYPGYWFAKTANDVLVVIQQQRDGYVVTGFADWRQQVDQALEEAAAALAGADDTALAA